ncbi:MAG: O-antigen ligase family protein [Rhodospirillales bacterium]
MAHADRLARLLPHALLLSVGAAFLLPTEAAYALIFYLTIPAFLVAAAIVGKNPPSHDPALWLAVALILWSALTLLWGTDDGHRAPRFALGAAVTLVFLLAVVLCARDAAWRERLRTLLVLLGTASAIFCVARFLLDPPFTLPTDTPRLRGWGATLHPVLGASVLAVALLTALHRATASTTQRGLHLFAAGAMAADILLTKSRGPILAAFLASLLLFAAARWWRAVGAAVVSAALAWALAPGALRASLVRAGEPGRFPIWRDAIRQALERPLLGHGLAANLRPAPGVAASFPHDLYLSLLFYSGAVGLLLFLALVAVLARRLWAARENPETTWLAALGLNALVAGLTDFGQITKGPGPLWLILWLPIALAIAAYPVRSSRGPS